MLISALGWSGFGDTCMIGINSISDSVDAADTETKIEKSGKKKTLDYFEHVERRNII